MFKRFSFYLLVIAVVAACGAAVRLHTGDIRLVNAVPVRPDEKPPVASVLLIPLDSRPPCQEFVEQLAGIANVAIRKPPAEWLDHYQQPADRQALRNWLLANAGAADAAIVSVDMLIHGGLVASRLNNGTPKDAQAVVELLKQVKTANPKLKLYIFSIIPRLIIADTPENMAHQKNMLAYSVQKDLLLTFENPELYKKLARLEEKLPPKLIERYNELYEQNKQLNQALIALAQQGVIEYLVIGQDDGQPFGLPNMTKTSIKQVIEHAGAADKVFVTRGTDEVALTVLGHIIAEKAHYQPRVHVRYTHKDAPSIVMPFMPHSVATTVEEKLRMVNGIQVESPEEADFTLVVHIGTRHTGERVMDQAAKEVASLLSSGHRVAVVDMTEDYFATETLFPALLKQDVPLLRLSAYAGWNTTSNSLGTAFAQMAILGATSRAATGDEAITVWNKNTAFLLSRFFDDWYFQKDVQPAMNASLRKAGIDPYHLGPQHAIVSSQIHKQLNEKAQYWFYRQLQNKSFLVETTSGPVQLMITDFSLVTELPWERTFEVRLKPQFNTIRIIQ